MAGSGMMPGIATLSLNYNENDVKRVEAITKGLL